MTFTAARWKQLCPSFLEPAAAATENMLLKLLKAWEWFVACRADHYKLALDQLLLDKK